MRSLRRGCCSDDRSPHLRAALLYYRISMGAGAFLTASLALRYALPSVQKSGGGGAMAVGTGVRAEWVTYPGDDVNVSAYLARPDDAETYPGIVMIHENPGLTEHRQEVTRLLAAEGYIILTPNLFSRIGGKPPGGDDHERHRAIGQAVRDEQVHGDLMHGYDFLIAKAGVIPDRMGLIGFCMGGAKGLYTACNSNVFNCLVDFYGPVEQSAERYGIGRSLLPHAKNLSCPIQFHSGTKDTSCTPEEHEALKAALARHGKEAEFYMYEGAKHGFHGAGENHHPEHAPVAWSRALGFLHRHLKT
jgi:carboxymethylenebutenolidase